MEAGKLSGFRDIVGTYSIGNGKSLLEVCKTSNFIPRFILFAGPRLCQGTLAFRPLEPRWIDLPIKLPPFPPNQLPYVIPLTCLRKHGGSQAMWLWAANSGKLAACWRKVAYYTSPGSQETGYLAGPQIRPRPIWFIELSYTVVT
jgi:hypothetical protein